MKSAHKVLAVLFVAGCVMNGCTQDKLPTEFSVPDQLQSPTGTGVIRANIDGLPWAAEDISGMSSGTSTYTGHILHISGARAVVGDTAKEAADAEAIDLTIDLGAAQTDIGPGTYKLGTIPAQEGEAQYHDALSCVCYTSSTHSGTVTITALDVSRKVVSGRFAFNGMGASGHGHIVSEGMFDVAWK